jgi:iron(III) transport system substrate-binding protein
MTPVLRLALFTILGGLAAGSHEASGQTLKPEQIATYKGADRAALLEAGAKKEGAVQLYTTGTQIEPILKRFQEIYPYLKLSTFRADGADVARRMIEEYKAQRYVVDTIVLNTGGLQAMLDAGALQPFYNPEEAAYPADAKEAKGHWINAYEAYVGVGFNTKAVSVAEAPKTWDDLLDPKWTGKMALSGRSGTTAHFVGNLVLTKGKDFVMHLGKQKFTVYEISGRALSNLVVSGEVPLSPMIYNSHMVNSASEGAPVSWNAPGSVYAGAGAAAIAKRPPHPHAAMLLSDFFLSKEGQTMREKIGDSSARADVSRYERPKQMLYLTDRPNYAQEYEEWSDLAEKAFGPPKGKR